jgi:hypothetical protein
VIYFYINICVDHEDSVDMIRHDDKFIRLDLVEFCIKAMPPFLDHPTNYFIPKQQPPVLGANRDEVRAWR